MKLIPLTIGLAMLATAGAADARQKLRGEARVAEITAGREMGRPVNCISLRNIRSSEIVDKTAIVYRMNNGTLYVNRPDGETFLDDDDILVTKTSTSLLCSIDIVTLVDRNAHFFNGTVTLGEFVPYAKPVKTASRD